MAALLLAASGLYCSRRKLPLFFVVTIGWCCCHVLRRLIWLDRNTDNFALANVTGCGLIVFQTAYAVSGDSNLLRKRI